MVPHPPDTQGISGGCKAARHLASLVGLPVGGTLMFGSSLRARLFQAIAVVVLICVSLTIGLGLVLTRRAV